MAPSSGSRIWRPLAIVVHAQPLTRQVIIEALDDQVEVLEATSVQHALLLAEQITPDFLFVGEILPDGTALDLIRRMRRDRGALTVVELLQSGADVYLQEPVTPTQIRDAASRFADRGRMRKAAGPVDGRAAAD